MPSPSSSRGSKVGFDACEVSHVLTVDRDAGYRGPASPTSPHSPFDPDAVAVVSFGSRRRQKPVGFSMNRDVTLNCWKNSVLMQKRRQVPGLQGA